MLLYASNRRLEGWGSLDVGGQVELFIWRSVSSLETAPMWVSPTQTKVAGVKVNFEKSEKRGKLKEIQKNQFEVNKGNQESYRKSENRGKLLEINSRGKLTQRVNSRRSKENLGSGVS